MGFLDDIFYIKAVILITDSRVVKKHLPLLLIFATIFMCFNSPVKAQSVELMAGNSLNGAMNGVLLGGATMALQNSDDFDPVRVSLGAGTLYGIGMGVYDVSKTSKGQQFYISGTFNDGTNTSILVLLDTIYGAAGGAIVASSVSLILKKPLTDALQYGSGAGAWIGFGFGLVDAFVLSNGADLSRQNLSVQRDGADGMLTYSNSSESINIGMLSPTFFQKKEVSGTSIRTRYKPALQVIELKIDL